MRVLKCCSLSLVLSLLLICLPVASASELTSPWVELLEYGTINSSGANTFSFKDSITVNIPMPSQMRAHRIEILVSFNENQSPSSVSLLYGGEEHSLTIRSINSTTARVYGTIPGAFYSSLNLKFTRNSNSTAWYEMFSCRITPLQRQDIKSSADMDFWYTSWVGDTSQQEYKWIKQGESFSAVGSLSNAVDVWQARVNVWDWDKFDSITIWGAVDLATVNSIRATVGTIALPVEVNFLDATTGDYFNDPDVVYPDLYGRYVFSATVDVSQVDPTVGVEKMEIYLTGKYFDGSGMIMQFQSCTGSLLVADTQNITWWNRFTSFMTDLFGADDSVSDDYQEEAGQQRVELDDMNQQLENVTKPPVDGIQMDVNDYIDGSDTQALSGALAALTGDSLMISMMCIVLTIALVGYVLYGKR